jgi:hypothetical protein
MGFDVFNLPLGIDVFASIAAMSVECPQCPGLAALETIITRIEANAIHCQFPPHNQVFEADYTILARRSIAARPRGLGSCSKRENPL